MASISIIIITYNRAGDLLDLLRDLSALEGKEEVLQELILLNNASTTSYSEVAEFLLQTPSLKASLINAPSNLGVAAGRNFAASKAKGDLLLFLDDDVLVEDTQLLFHLSKSFERDTGKTQKIGVISCKVRYSANRELQVNAFPHKAFGKRKDLPYFLTSYYVGCAHAFSRECWFAAGNYPEDFFYGMEEYDLSYRVLDAGFLIGYDASVEVFHKESPEGRQPLPEKLRMMWVNKSVVAWRYLPPIYFFTTALAWSGFYLFRTKAYLPEFLKGVAAVARIPFTTARRPLKKQTMQYLRNVKARLPF